MLINETKNDYRRKRRGANRGVGVTYIYNNTIYL